MDDHNEGREQIFKQYLDNGERKNSCVVSLGDLGESKAIDEGSSELFAGTTRCFEFARKYFDGFKVY